MDLFIVIVLALLAVMGIVVGVSNDAVNFLNSAFGSKAAKKNIILSIAAAGVMVGVMTSSGMMDVARSGVFYPAMFSYQEIMILFLGMMLSNIILLDIYNSLGLPTSTTVSLVFGLLGSAMALALYNIWSGDALMSDLGRYINSGNALAIVSGILLSVVLAFFTGHLLMYISRVIFSFRYHKLFNRFGALWCGITVAGIIYFTVFKGLKSTNIIPDILKDYVNDHTGMALLILWLGSSALLWILQRCKVNILRVSILAGTFSLALAFAGNDLVNFIGVPYAGYDSYMIAQNSDTDPTSMAQLMNPTQANFWIMCAAGLVMVITLFTSKKAMRVIETERKLSSQSEEAPTNSEATNASRGIVRGARALSNAVEAITPKSIRNFIDSRFVALSEEERGDVNYDLIRATVNLTAAAILISIGTQLKLPLSTTYVVFMVSMGSSLADRAWGRESAVYRITGVMTVIMGWFITALGGFIIAIGVTLALAYGQNIAINDWNIVAIAVTVVCIGLIIKSNVGSKKNEDKEVEESAVAKISDTLKQSPEEALIAYTEHVCASMEKVTLIYDRTIVAVFKENRKVLRDMVSEAEEFYHSTRQQKYEIIPLLRTLEESDINTGHFYVQVVDYISETSKALLHITRPCYKHVDNNHSGLTKEQVYDLKCINDRVENIFGDINHMLRTRSFEQMEEVLTKRDELFNFIDEVMQNQLRRLRDTGGSSSANMLFFNILTETKTMILHSRNIMKSLEHFVDQEE
ncbi:MAG: inorganic phosphate transporter [Alistipes sp.]|nr:inorganic phosphate transporter [Alistipes sp.]